MLFIIIIIIIIIYIYSGTINLPIFRHIGKKYKKFQEMLERQIKELSIIKKTLAANCN